MKYHDHHINGILICVDRGPVHRHVNSYFQPAEYASLVWQSRFPNACASLCWVLCVIVTVLSTLCVCHVFGYPVFRCLVCVFVPLTIRVIFLPQCVGQTFLVPLLCCLLIG